MKGITPSQSKKMVTRWARGYAGAKIRELITDKGEWPAELFKEHAEPAEPADRANFKRELEYLAQRLDKGHVGGWFGSKAGRKAPIANPCALCGKDRSGCGHFVGGGAL